MPCAPWSPLSLLRSDFLKSVSFRVLLMTDAELTVFFGTSFFLAADAAGSPPLLVVSV